MRRRIVVEFQPEELRSLTQTLVFAEGCAQMMGPACMDIYLNSMALRDVLYSAAAGAERKDNNENRPVSSR